jgi:cysteine desulfurase
LALSGVLWAARKRGIERPHLVTTSIEHSAIMEQATWLESVGFDVTYVGSSREGMIDPADIADAITSRTALISVMYANNEVGSIQPVIEIAAVAHDRGISFHTDATQAAGLLPIDRESIGADLLSLSAHKFYGPKGVGALVARRDTVIDWQQHGGGQEGGRRGGTENVAGIVGMAAALVEAESLRSAYADHCRAHRDQLWTLVREKVPGIAINGPALDGARLPNNLNVRLPGIQGETMLVNLDLEDVAASAGSACSVGKNEPSHVLLAMGQSVDEARSSLRLTVGRATSESEILHAALAIGHAVERIRLLR